MVATQELAQLLARRAIPPKGNQEIKSDGNTLTQLRTPLKRPVPLPEAPKPSRSKRRRRKMELQV